MGGLTVNGRRCHVDGATAQKLLGTGVCADGGRILGELGETMPAHLSECLSASVVRGYCHEISRLIPEVAKLGMEFLERMKSLCCAVVRCDLDDVSLAQAIGRIRQRRMVLVYIGQREMPSVGCADVF
jgi:hypothetical protein